MQKRILSFVLVLCMLLALVPSAVLPVLAAEGDVTIYFQTKKGQDVSQQTTNRTNLQFDVPAVPDGFFGWYYHAPDGQLYSAEALLGANMDELVGEQWAANAIYMTAIGRESVFDYNSAWPAFSANFLYSYRNGWSFGYYHVGGSGYMQMSNDYHVDTDGGIVQAKDMWGACGQYVANRYRAVILGKSAAMAYSYTAVSDGKLDLDLSAFTAWNESGWSYANGVKLAVAVNGSVVWPEAAKGEIGKLTAETTANWFSTGATGSSYLTKWNDYCAANGYPHGISVQAGDRVDLVILNASLNGNQNVCITPSVTYTEATGEVWRGMPALDPSLKLNAANRINYPKATAHTQTVSYSGSAPTLVTLSTGSKKYCAIDQWFDNNWSFGIVKRNYADIAANTAEAEKSATYSYGTNLAYTPYYGYDAAWDFINTNNVWNDGGLCATNTNVYVMPKDIVGFSYVAPYSGRLTLDLSWGATSSSALVNESGYYYTVLVADETIDSLTAGDFTHTSQIAKQSDLYLTSETLEVKRGQRVYVLYKLAGNVTSADINGGKQQYLFNRFDAALRYERINENAVGQTYKASGVVQLNSAEVMRQFNLGLWKPETIIWNEANSNAPIHEELTYRVPVSMTDTAWVVSKTGLEKTGLAGDLLGPSGLGWRSKDLTASANNLWSTSGGGNLRYSTQLQPNSNTIAGYSYTAELGGTVSPRLEAFTNNGSTKGLAILVNDRIVWPEGKTHITVTGDTNAAKYHFYSVAPGTTADTLNALLAETTFTVKRGDRITFAVVSNPKSGETANYCALTPSVTYLPITVSAGIDLASNVGFNLYAATDATVTDMTVALNGRTVVANELGAYVAGNIAAKEMTDTITYEIRGTHNGIEHALLAEGSTSVAEIMTHYLQSKDARTVAIAVAALNYGAAAQTYFHYKTDTLANAILTEEQKTVTCTGDYTAAAGIALKDAAPRAELLGMSLLLEERIQLKLVLSTAEESFAVQMATNPDFTDATTLDHTATNTGNAYKAISAGIAPANWNTLYYFRVVDQNGNAISHTLVYSVAAYCQNMAGDASVNAVTNAILALYDAAAAYRA